MPKGVVRRLQLVDVDHRYGERAARLAGADDLGLEALEENAAVREARQPVGRGPHPRLFVPAGDAGHGRELMRHPRQPLLVLPVQSAPPPTLDTRDYDTLD